MSCISGTFICPPVTGTKALRRQPRQRNIQAKQTLPCRCKQLLGSHPRSRQETGRGLVGRTFALPQGTNTSSEDPELHSSGVVVFRRSANRTNYKVATSLEKLGLQALSSQASREEALAMGLKDAEAEAENESVTPVAVSWDVMKEGRDLRLIGAAETAISVICNRCLSSVAERVYGQFSLLLTEKPVEEPTQERLGIVLGGPTHAEGPDELGAGLLDLDLDLDDKMHFPKGALELDISKYIRDTIHLEIPTISICGLSCKGLCVTCGINLNKSQCTCQSQEAGKWGALDQLRKQLQEQEKR